MSFKTTSKNLGYIWKKLLKLAQKKGIPHNQIDQIVGIKQKVNLTKAEIWAGRQLERWLLEDIGERYDVVGGKTYRVKISIEFAECILIPSRLARERIQLISKPIILMSREEKMSRVFARGLKMAEKMDSGDLL